MGNDPDMLIIGNFGLSLEQSKAQMGMWCMLAAPLIMSNDLRTLRPEFKEILLNRELIKLDQDPLGIQAKRLVAQQHIHVYSRPVMPLYKGKASVAVALTILLDMLQLTFSQGSNLEHSNQVTPSVAVLTPLVFSWSNSTYCLKQMPRFPTR